MTSKHRAHDVMCSKFAGGSLRLDGNEHIGAVSDRSLDWLEQWVDRTPNAIFIAERSGAGWREVTFPKRGNLRVDWRQVFSMPG